MGHPANAAHMGPSASQPVYHLTEWVLLISSDRESWWTLKHTEIRSRKSAAMGAGTAGGRMKEVETVRDLVLRAMLQSGIRKSAHSVHPRFSTVWCRWSDDFSRSISVAQHSFERKKEPFHWCACTIYQLVSVDLLIWRVVVAPVLSKESSENLMILGLIRGIYSEFVVNFSCRSTDWW